MAQGPGPIVPTPADIGVFTPGGSPLQHYGTHANRPVSTFVPDGSLYMETDTGQTYQTEAGVWELAAHDGGGVSPIYPVKPPTPVAVTGFQSGHGFFTSLAGTATSNLNDTSAFINGTQCLSVVTGGDAGNNYVKHNTISPLIDTTGKMIRVWTRLPNQGDIANLTNVLLYVSTDNVVANYYGFNSVSTGFNSDYWANDFANASNQWQPVTMSFGEQTTVGAPTRNAINSIWLRVNDAHSQPVTVQFGGIELIPEPSGGCVSFTFDDARLTQYTQGRMYLSKYRFPATAYIIREVVDNAIGATLPDVAAPYYLSTAQLRELQEYHGWEIAAHADILANHNLPNGLVDLTPDMMDREMQAIRNWLLRNGFNGANSMAYPRGRHNQTLYDVCRKYYTSSRGTFSNSNGTGWIKHETFPPSDRNKLTVFYVYGNTPLANMQAAVDSAFTNKEWLIFVLHDLVTTPNGARLDTQAKIADFQSLVDYVATKGIAVRTVGDVMAHGM